MRRIYLSEMILMDSGVMVMVKKWLRRLAALLLAATTLVTAAASEEGGSTGDSGAVRWLLEWTLGRRVPADALSPSAALALYQSPMLFSARQAVNAVEAAEAEADKAAPEDAAEDVEPPPAVPDASTLPEISLPALSFPDNGVPAQTVKITNTTGYTVVRDVCIKNASNKTLDAAALAEEPFSARLTDSAPQVLILHTHGSEAYTMPEGQEYVSTGTCRTSDTTKNVVRVGDEIATVLSACGISVLHDRTLYDDPLYDGAYGRSLEGLDGYLEKYPSITFVLDIHRDAVEDSQGRQYKLIAQEEPNAAQISFVMGSNHEGWQENLKLAVAVAEAIRADYPTVARPITLRNSNYNQHRTSGSMLVEIGAAGNSLDEALNSARIFATALSRVLLSTRD